jgi:hypothetical protein
MGVNIGDITIPFVSTFSVDKSSKPTEQIKHLGNVPPHVAEFQADVLKFIMDGTLFQASGDVRDVDQYAEDITALVERFGVYNSIYDYQGRSGWLIIDSGDSDKSADSVLIRNYSLGGRFMPKNRYQARMHTAPAILTNDFSLTLGSDGCDNYVPIPIGATYSGGDDATITRTGQDGAVTLVKATTNKDITWDLAADEVDVGECKVWDSVIVDDATEANWVRVFNKDHVFTGDCYIENGLIRIKKVNNVIPTMYIYDSISATYEIIGTSLRILVSGSGGVTQLNFRIDSLTSDSITIKSENYKTSVPIDRGTFTLTINKGQPFAMATLTGEITHIYMNSLISADCRFGYEPLGDTVTDYLMSVGDIENKAIEYVIGIGTTDTIAICASVGGASYASAYITHLGRKTFEDTDEIFLGGIKAAYVANLFKECEDMTQGAGVAFYTGVDASPKTGNTGSILNAQNENVYYEFTGGTDLPLGTYKLFLRAKDSAQVADDISCLVRNTTDSTDVMAETTKTLTGSWAYYSFDVTIASDDDTDTIRVTLNKETATANTIDLDYVLWVPITLDSGNGPQDISHQAMVDQKLNRELIAR